MEFLKTFLGGAGGAALVAGLFALIQWRLNRKAQKEDKAADIYCSGISQLRVETELDKIGGVRYHYAIKGSSNVHFDVPKGNRLFKGDSI